jgi:hypothetical protein
MGLGDGGPHVSDRSEIDAIKAAHDIVEVAKQYTTLTGPPRELKGRSPLKAERTPSFTVDATKQLWFCFASNQGGDVIDLVAACENISVGEAIRRLKESAGLEQNPELVAKRAAEQRQRELKALEAEEREGRRNLARAADIWKHAHRAEGSVVETYLAMRGIDLWALERVHGWRVPQTLRFAEGLQYWDSEAKAPCHRGPAMVGYVCVSPEAERNALTGIHRTWLAPAGTGKAELPKDSSGNARKAKLTLGKVWGSGGWLEHRSDDVIVGEGYETTLSVLSVLAKAGRRVGAVSACNLGNLAGGGLGRGEPHPTIPGVLLPSLIPDPAKPGLVLPSYVKTVTVLADADGADPLATACLVKRAAAKFRQRGHKVRIAWPAKGKDFNDMVQRAEVTA